MVKSAFTHVKNAYEQTPNDASIKKFFEEVRSKHDQIEKAEKEANGSLASDKYEEHKGNTKDKLLSRVKIDEDDKLPPIGKTLPEEETKERPSASQDRQQP